MHFVAKKTGKIRRVVDFQKLNKACLRQTHPTKAPLLQCQSVPPNSTNTVLEDRHLTTFLTPWGRYKYCNLPQGHMAAGDTYTACYDKITQGFLHMERCVDNMILHNSNLEYNFNQVCQYIMTCSRAGITFKDEKFCFGRQRLEYLGYNLGKDSVEPSKNMLRSITEFPEP